MLNMTVNLGRKNHDTNRKAGFECVRIRGSHERWIHPKLPEFPITLAGKDGKDAKPYL
jgi:predicted RNA binding protein YcfA (HicA-like mRNA interferase family)